MLLIYPPLAKPGEAPAGLALLAGALRGNGLSHGVADLAIEGADYLIRTSPPCPEHDRWGRRSWNNRLRNLEQIREPAVYHSPARYRKVVLELNKVLAWAANGQAQISLANYHDAVLSATASRDLLRIAEEPERSPFYRFYRQRLPELLAAHAPRHVGVSINFLSQALNGFALIGLVRQLAPGVTVVAGGGLITSWMRSSRWVAPFAGLVDACVAGCGVGPLLELHGHPPVAGDDVVSDFQGLPVSRYLSPGFVLPYSCSRGCFWNRCRFCPERAEGSRFTARSPSVVRRQVGQLVSRYQPVLIHFLDNAIPPAVLADFDEEHPGVPWYGFARISRQFADPDFCRRLRASGCVMLKLGLESGSQAVLDQLEKGTDLETAAIVLENLRAAGIATYVYLLFGTPAETLAEARQTLDFVRRHQAAIGFLNLAIFNMPIDGPDRDNVETTPFSEDDLALYTDFRHPHGWDRRQIRMFLDREFKRQPEIAAILRRDPPHFTSNHAPFFCG